MTFPPKSDPEPATGPIFPKQASEGLVLIDERRSATLAAVRRHAPSKEGNYLRAYGGKSLRAAITAKCLDCTCDQVNEIKRCPVTQCPLWQYRPYSKGGRHE